MDFKYVSLVVLVMQTTTLVLIMRYSRAVAMTGPRYLASTAVVMAEVLKLVASVLLYWVELYRASPVFRCPKKFLGQLWEDLFGEPKETLKLVVPALLFTVQNNLLYVALSNLDAATYQVTYQLKIMTTAIFSVLLLGRSLSGRKWLSLVILMAGVALVQFPSSTSSLHLNGRPILGVVAVLLACCSSGFAGVYFEKIVKGTTTSVWLRNFQLAVFSMLLGLGGVAVDLTAVQKDGFFQGYTHIVGVVVCLQALGGLVVAAVIKYADNILKGFATSVSLVFSSVISVVFLADLQLSMFFVIGASLVVLATMLYSQPDAKPQPEPEDSSPPKTEHV